MYDLELTLKECNCTYAVSSQNETSIQDRLRSAEDLLLQCLQEPAVVVWVTSPTTYPGVLKTTDCKSTSGQDSMEGLHHPAGFEIGDSRSNGWRMQEKIDSKMDR